MNGKFYWLKLKRDFFKRHDILYIRSRPDGDRIALFYLMLMTESVDHDGELRFSEALPYTPELLSAITIMPIELIERSIELFKEIGLIKISDDGTIVLDKVKTMIGSAVDNDNANRQRRYRASRSNVSVTKNNASVTECVTKNNESKSKRKSKSKSKSKRQNNKYIFVAPSVDEVYEYCKSRNNTINPQLFVDYYQSKNWLVSNGCQMTDWKAAVRAWENNQINYKNGDQV